MSQIFTKIILKALHTKLFHIVFSVILLTLGTTTVFSQEIKLTDSIKLNSLDLKKVKDSTAKDSSKKKKPFLDGIVNMKHKN